VVFRIEHTAAGPKRFHLCGQFQFPWQITWHFIERCRVTRYTPAEMEDAMKVGIIGSGDVAKTLAGGLLKHGHDVKVGTRAPAKLVEWGEQNPKASVGSFADAAAFGELIMLAVKGDAAPDALSLAGASNLAGKAVMDTCNPIQDAPPVHGVLRFFTAHDESLMEKLQRDFQDAYFVKAFNSVGAASMVNPHFSGGKPTMFICGNDPAAKKQVSRIAEEFGWETADMGMAEAARAIEPLCMLWCIPGFLRNEWTHAFKLLLK
jgi:8-hydroxy-5-deazaflavin:NADPH oxidoreductase